MAKLHWIVNAYDKTREKSAHGIASRSVDAHISSWKIAIDSHLTDNETGSVVVENHETGKPLGTLIIKDGKVEFVPPN